MVGWFGGPACIACGISILSCVDTSFCCLLRLHLLDASDPSSSWGGERRKNTSRGHNGRHCSRFEFDALDSAPIMQIGEFVPNRDSEEGNEVISEEESRHPLMAIRKLSDTSIDGEVELQIESEVAERLLLHENLDVRDSRCSPSPHRGESMPPKAFETGEPSELSGRNPMELDGQEMQFIPGENPQKADPCDATHSENQGQQSAEDIN
ncbi:hypothetical protein Dimus_030106, partial [Dionaea muscipula]